MSAGAADGWPAAPPREPIGACYSPSGQCTLFIAALDDVWALCSVWSVVHGAVGLATVGLLISSYLLYIGAAFLLYVSRRVTRRRRRWAIHGSLLGGRRRRRKRRSGRVRACLLGHGTLAISDVTVNRLHGRCRRRKLVIAWALVFLATCRLGEAKNQGRAEELPH